MSAAVGKNMDDIQVELIEALKPRLRGLLAVDPLLGYLDFIQTEHKERIRQKARAEGDIVAADLLIDAVIKKPHTAGWFRAFLDALQNSGCEYAADYLQDNPPDPATEAENDDCVRLIRLLSPSLVKMKTTQVYLHCWSKGLLTPEDTEIIVAETANRGSRSGATELLRRIVRGRPGWFSDFLQILKETEHQNLYELTGGSPDIVKEGSEVAAEETPTAAAECLDSLSQEVTSIEMAEDSPEENTDLYREAHAKSEQEPNGPEPPQPDGPEPAAAAGDPEDIDITLRDYQMDVARPALEGKNIIVCLPTGSGKTRVAVYITKKHLDRRMAEGQSGKVVILVNKVPLVEQHYTSEFFPLLKSRYKVERVSGDNQLKISFTETVKKNDVIICTAQILENFLDCSNKGDDEGVNLSDLTLIVIDECHHTQKGNVYNHIMMRYLKQKHKNMKLKKVEKKAVPLPQILGLTASPGVGGATKMDKAVEHILKICANLDASRIMTGNLEDGKKEPRKQTLTIEDRKEDPFNDVIKNIMKTIHAHAKLTPSCDLDSQIYEQWIVDKSQKAAVAEDHDVQVCAEHLRRYNGGLILSNTIRMRDALSFLNVFHLSEMKRKTTPDDEHKIQITDTERFLFNLFKDNKEELQRLSEMPQYENDSLSKLRSKILYEFSSREEARGIIFITTRLSAITLSQWVQENPKFADIGIKAAFVIGGGDQSVIKPMTSAERKAVLDKFRHGVINLLFATSVAVEGLDVPACNFVIRYGFVTNEISMIQAEGRGRAEDSSHTVVEVKNSGVGQKETVNEFRRKMMVKAINKIKDLDQEYYDKQITEFQFQAVNEERMRKINTKRKEIKNEKPSEVKFSCRGCSKPICTGEDIQIIEDMHRVNVTEHFRELYIQRENTSLQERCLDYETNGIVACKNCGQAWGSLMMFHGMECPSLHVKNFLVTVNGKKSAKYTRWNELAVKLAPFDYAEHARKVADSSDDDDEIC